MEILKNNHTIYVCAHRGYMSKFPENSLLAFQKALDLNVDAIEMDLHYTKDQKIVIFHDESIDRMTNGSGRVEDLTLEELREYKLLNPDNTESNETIPTFEEYLNLTKNYDSLYHFVEIKEQKDSVDLLEEVYLMLKERSLLSRTLLTSFDYPVIVAAHNKKMFTQGFLFSKMKNKPENEDNYYDLLNCVGLFKNDVTEEEVSFAKNQDLQMTLVPIDTTEDINIAVDLGINIFASDELENTIEYRNKR
ncbi:MULTISPECIES: glycerophosphodiester phosphodiesterase [Oceanobacillus]|uniref:glycerophosphodiester phosphodiesterase n=1 Tax=Oceanobacillus TaxID=182709 RepID=UPI001EE3B5F7|nr:glycerophosphodiester phosphodiesterase family protein [Oceanobacillus alkalisoli]MCG5103322.1 hypothetical protein [Oceanobacillus alkalisoli]